MESSRKVSASQGKKQKNGRNEMDPPPVRIGFNLAIPHSLTFPFRHLS